MPYANPDKYGRQRIHVQVPFELVVQLDRFRYEQPYFDRSRVITEAIREFLARHGEPGSERRLR